MKDVRARLLLSGALTAISTAALTTAVHAEATGTRGGGRTVDIGGSPYLSDLVTNTNCDWWSGPDFAANTDFPLIETAVEATHWYFAEALARELSAMAFCATYSPLLPVPDNDQDSVGIGDFGGTQVAVRINDEVYVDMNVFNRLDRNNQGFLILHEALHGFLQLNIPRRNQKLRSMVAAVKQHTVTPMSKERFALQLTHNSVDIVPLAARLDSLRTTLELILDPAADPIGRKEEACYLLTERPLMERDLHYRDETTWASLINLGNDPVNPLKHAIDIGNEACAARIAQWPAVDLSWLDAATGKNLLMHATAADMATVIAALLSSNRINAEDYDRSGRNALHYADSSAAITLLLASTAIDPNHGDMHRQTLLHLAAIRGRLDLVQTLLTHPTVDINAQDASPYNGGGSLDQSPLMLAILPDIFTRVQSTPVNHDLIDYLVDDSNIDINQKAALGTALHYAAMRCDARVVGRLLAHPAIDPRAVVDNINTPSGTRYRPATTAKDLAEIWSCHQVFNMLP